MPISRQGLAAADYSHQAALRKREAARNDLISTLQTDKLLRAKIDNDDNVENGRRTREFMYHNSEKQKTMALQKEQETAQKHKECLELDIQNRAKEERERSEALRTEKLRQKICAASSELRALQQKLDCAYMNVERARQVEEAKCKQLAAHHEENEYARQVEKAAAANTERLKQQQQELELRCEQYRRELQAQLAHKEHLQRQHCEAFAREKAMVDAAVATIVAENKATALREHAKREQTRAYIAEHAVQKEARRAQERARLEWEEHAIAEHVVATAHRARELERQRRDLEDRRAEMRARISEAASRVAVEKGEAEALRIELAQQEELERQEQREREADQKRIRLRLELIDAHAQQIAHRRRMREAEAESEEVYRRRLQEQMEKDAKLEQLGREQRRFKQIEHRREIDRLVAQRKERLLAEQHADDEDTRKQQELERYKQAVIENERQRLLRQHAQKLVGFLPKGVLQEEKDLDLFDDEFRRRFESGMRQ